MKRHKQTRSNDSCETLKINKQSYANNIIKKTQALMTTIKMKINGQANIKNNSVSNNFRFCQQKNFKMTNKLLITIIVTTNTTAAQNYEYNHSNTWNAWLRKETWCSSNYYTIN